MGNITFTETKPGTLDPETGLFTTPSTSTVVGEMVEIKPDAPLQNRGDTLVPAHLVKGLFTPDTYGQVPALGSTVDWPATAGDTFHVASVETLAPDSVAIKSNVVLTR